jgi:hypothetical protein
MAMEGMMRIDAMSMDLPAVAGHPNRIPFSGILARVGVPSDAAPTGSNGKRVLLTRAAAETALVSLLGMGVDMKADLHGHDTQKKIGIITRACIDGDAVRIEGHLWASDFPALTASVQRSKADLGFSFEARDLSVESAEADPMVITRCVFTGAAIMLRNEAAYRTTSLAAAAERKDVVLVHSVLLKKLKLCGFDRCEGVDDTLSDQQMAAVMKGEPVSERIRLKQLIEVAGIEPVCA